MADPIDTATGASSRLVLLMGSGPGTSPAPGAADLRLRREWKGRAVARLFAVEPTLRHGLPGRSFPRPRHEPSSAEVEPTARILRGPAPRPRHRLLTLAAALLVAAVLVALASGRA